jgi:flagellar basal body-associated protein FliL
LTADTPSDPRKTGTYRVMLAVVIILGVLIVAAFAALVIGGIMKVAGHKAATAQAPAALSATLPADAKIVNVETTGNRVVLTVRTPRGDEVDIFDTDTGRPVARIAPAR